MPIYRPHYLYKNTPEGGLAKSQCWDHKWVLIVSLGLPYLFVKFPQPLTHMMKVSWLALASCLLAVAAGILVQSIHNRRGVIDKKTMTIRQGTLRDVTQVALINLSTAIMTALIAHAVFFEQLPGLYLIAERNGNTQTAAPFVDTYHLHLKKRSYSVEMSDLFRDYALGRIDDADPMASINYLLTAMDYPKTDADWKFTLKSEYSTQGRYLVEPYLGGKIELDTYDHLGQRYASKVVITTRHPPNLPRSIVQSAGIPSEPSLSAPQTTATEGAPVHESNIWFPDD